MSYRESGSTDIRAAEICGEGEYGMVRADRGRKNIWDSSDNAGFFGKTTEMAGGCLGGVDKVRHI